MTAQDSSKSLDSTALRIRVAELCGWRNDGMGWWYNDERSHSDATIGRREPPNFPFDHNAAIQLCDVLEKDGWLWSADNERGYVVFEFSRYDKKTGWQHQQGTAPTLSEAICRAFVAVMEQHLEEKEA